MKAEALQIAIARYMANGGQMKYASGAGRVLYRPATDGASHTHPATRAVRQCSLTGVAARRAYDQTGCVPVAMLMIVAITTSTKAVTVTTTACQKHQFGSMCQCPPPPRGLRCLPSLRVVFVGSYEGHCATG